MEVAVEVEDDVFFADLSKQINLLIMDDEEDEDMVMTHSPSVSFQGFSQSIQFQQQQQQPQQQLPIFFHEQISCRARESCSSKGTGVFIPRSSSNQRRKNRHGLRNNNNNNIMSSNAKMFQKHLEHSRGIPAVHHHQSYTEPSYNNSFNTRRF